MDLYTQNIKNWKHRLPLYLSAGFIMFFIIWANIFEINEHVAGTGRIITAGKSRIIQHLEGGIIKDIFVKEGQTVEKGDVLFNITNKNADAELKENKIILKSYYVTLSRLESEHADYEDIVFKENVDEEALADLIKSERKFFKSRRLEFIEKIKGMEERYKQKSHKLEELSETIKNIKQELNIAREQLKIKTKLYESGAISKSIYLEAQSTEKNFLTRISSVETEIPVMRAESAEILNLIEEAKQKRKSSIVEEINGLKIDIERIKERVSALQDQYNRTAVLSPVKGIVDKLAINTIGGVVKSGQTLTEITPLEEKLIVEGKISTASRGKIWLGLPVLAKLTAYDYTVYGGIDGIITYISPDSYFDNRNVEYYKIKVSINTESIPSDMNVFPGMTVDLGIIRGKISIMDAILRPFWNIRDNALRDM